MSNTNINYISLGEAAKLTNYSQEYISLLCRQKKLEGTKIGRNWVTTKEWIENYVNKTKGSGENIVPVKIKNTKKQSISDAFQADESKD
ncbi:helix-turn-helix domain-containing protein, partial [Candidatus Parcubacteria bacterium]|nr:helix-turn-helix domain-containing protein [Candidatus Parcubacteria bacterium]